MQLELETDPLAGVAVVAINGCVGATTVEELERGLDELVASARSLVVDLHQVSVFEAVAAPVLVDLHERLGTRLRVIVERGGAAQRCLEAAGLGHVLALHRSREAAPRGLSGFAGLSTTP